VRRGSGLNVELSEAVRASVVDGAVQAAIGRQVPRLFVAAGPVGVTAAPRVIPSDPGFFRLLLGHDVDQLCRRDVIEPARVDAWWEAMDEAAAAGHFTGGGTSVRGLRHRELTYRRRPALPAGTTGNSGVVRLFEPMLGWDRDSGDTHRIAIRT